MKREFSAGGVILQKHGDNWEVLLVRNQSLKDPEIYYWGFPKGHIEEGEETKKAAVREVLEETGVETEIIEKIGDSRYVFFSPQEGEKVFKVVSFFLMKYLSGEPKAQDGEISEAKWFPVEEALKVFSFPKDKELLKKAIEMMKKKE
ncbi:MAG: NUDIX hydrolase [Candidatus Daviesbacteria bacterium]